MYIYVSYPSGFIYEIIFLVKNLISKADFSPYFLVYYMYFIKLDLYLSCCAYLI